MLRFLDVLLSIVHLSITLFNLFGWIPRATRKAHFIMVALTAASWLLLGIWFGLGYCPFTDWQWNVKRKSGEQNLPSNFIEYFIEKLTEHDFDSGLINTIIAVTFIVVCLISVYVNFILPRRKKN